MLPAIMIVQNWAKAVADLSGDVVVAVVAVVAVAVAVVRRASVLGVEVVLVVCTASTGSSPLLEIGTLEDVDAGGLAGIVRGGARAVQYPK